MVRRFRKHTRKARGSRTHGYGEGKKHRGAGHMGGMGYRWRKHFKIKFLKEYPEHIGKVGFTHYPYKGPTAVLNIGELNEQVENYLAQGRAKAEAGKVVLELSALGIEKVLGTGKVNRPLIIIGAVSPKAKEKIEKAGGEVRNV